MPRKRTKYLHERDYTPPNYGPIDNYDPSELEGVPEFESYRIEDYGWVPKTPEGWARVERMEKHALLMDIITAMVREYPGGKSEDAQVTQILNGMLGRKPKRGRKSSIDPAKLDEIARIYFYCEIFHKKISVTKIIRDVVVPEAEKEGLKGKMLEDRIKLSASIRGAV